MCARCGKTVNVGTGSICGERGPAPLLRYGAYYRPESGIRVGLPCQESAGFTDSQDVLGTLLIALSLRDYEQLQHDKGLRERDAHVVTTVPNDHASVIRQRHVFERLRDRAQVLDGNGLRPVRLPAGARNSTSMSGLSYLQYPPTDAHSVSKPKSASIRPTSNFVPNRGGFGTRKSTSRGSGRPGAPSFR